MILGESIIKTCLFIRAEQPINSCTLRLFYYTMGDSNSIMSTIHISSTADDKSKRYLSNEELEDTIRNGEGYVCRRTSPNHKNLYNDSNFLMRGEFHGEKLDIVFAVNDDSIGVITQMSQHADSYRGRFYEKIGDSVQDAVTYVEEQNQNE